MENSTAKTAHLDILDPEFSPGGDQVRAARAANWYATTPAGMAVLRHKEIATLLSDRRLRQGSLDYVREQGLNESLFDEWLSSMLLVAEGDDHKRLRRLVTQAFTVRSVDALRPVMRRVANDLIDRFAGAGRADFMAAFADPYPARIICELLGVPAELHDSFRSWANDLGLAFGVSTAGVRERIEAALRGLNAATETLLAERRANPRADLLSALIAAEADGDRLSQKELLSLVSGLLFAGQDTTKHQLGRTLELFLGGPDQWAVLTAKPELARAAVEEALRLAPAAPVGNRVAVTDLEVNGLQIPADTFLWLFLIAGNTDPTVFGPDADLFDITAKRSTPALTFGGGIHYCLGAMLARVEMAEALVVLTERLGPIEADGDSTQRPPIGIVGPTNLPIRFQPQASSRQP